MRSIYKWVSVCDIALFIVSCLSFSSCNAQNERNQRSFDNGHGWDIRLAVPGEPGNDYPLLNSIPRTSFTCSGKEPGYYADIETNCQVFRVCTLGTTYGFQSFLCPNGTLFNQAVFVCDWWMQVNCEKTKEYISKNNDKFRNLRLGPEFMTDIKKMITHPMKNPYDKTFIKANQISMQEYRPPSGQMYNNPFLLTLEKNSNNVFSKGSQRNTFHDIYSTADISFAASTPGTYYLQNYNGFQKQLQNMLYFQQNKAGRLNDSPFNSVANAHGGQINNKITAINTTLNSPTNSRIQTYVNKNKGKQTTFGIEFSKQQLNQDYTQNQQLYLPRLTQARNSINTVTQGEKETKQNLVSNENKSGLITKTLAFRRIIKNPKDGSPRSRITFKTWIVRPSKSSKFNANTTSHSDKFSNAVENLSVKTTSSSLLAPVLSTNSPITKNKSEYKQYNSPRYLNIDKGQIIKPGEKVLQSRQSLTSPRYDYKSTLPTKASPAYLVATTYKPYFTNNAQPVERVKKIYPQYLLPIKDEYSQLVASGSSPTPLFKVPLQINRNDPTLIINKQSLINTNHNNLAFTDILTKEKLDISVNDIVKDTDEILKTASPDTIFPFEKNNRLSEQPLEEYLPANPDADSESYQQSSEKLTSQPLPPLPKSSRLVATLSPELEPPFEAEYVNQSKSNLSNLPYFKEPTLPPNTIERTVSLKITIPEKIAKNIFKNKSDNDLNNLEILNAGNSNYLVLTNNLADAANTKFIPIGKLIQNNKSNFSDSQDLVFSLLADSINTAKEYSNVAHQHFVKPTTLPQSHFQNLVKDELEKNSKDSTQVTQATFLDSNFSGYYKPTKSLNIEQSFSSEQTDNTNYVNRNQQFTNTVQPTQPTPEQNNQNQKYSSQNTTSDILNNSGKIYSGQLYQLPVPLVTRHVYNSPNPSISNFILSNNFLPSNTRSQSNTEVEIIPSQSVPLNSFETVREEQQIISDQGNSANIFIDDFEKPSNGITAQVYDNIIGTLPHPSDKEKQINYKKDQSYYFYSHFNHNNDNSLDIDSNENKIFTRNTSPSPPSSYQLLPSVGYKLEGDKEKENFLNAFQINQYGSLKQNPNEDISFNRREDVKTDIDFTVLHPPSSNKQSLGYLNALYDGPTSYTAPQASVGSLDGKQNSQKYSAFNAHLEKFDINDKGYGYPKPTSPAKRFLF